MSLPIVSTEQKRDRLRNIQKTINNAFCQEIFILLEQRIGLKNVPYHSEHTPIESLPSFLSNE